jgi:5-methylcytosine-specific restriction endonuclease McrA
MEEKCQSCGGNYRLGQHHIIFRSKYGSSRKEERDSDDNLVTLCKKCHDKIHARQMIILVNKDMKYIKFIAVSFIEQWKKLKIIKNRRK